jgi:hypothetical protein
MLIVRQLLFALAGTLFAYGAWYTNEGAKFLQQQSIVNLSATPESDLLELIAGYAISPAMAGVALVCFAESLKTTYRHQDQQSHQTG